MDELRIQVGLVPGLLLVLAQGLVVWQEGEEQQEVDARVKEIIKNERPQEPHRRTAKDE